MPAEQVESLMQVKLSQVRIELQTHFKAEVANVLQKQQGRCLENAALKAEIDKSRAVISKLLSTQAQAQLRCMKKDKHFAARS